jgi:porphobilinogen synthase
MTLPGFPIARPRRLRTSPASRRLVAETSLNVSQLVLPLFARSGRKLRRPVEAMPGVFQLSPDEILREATAAHALGVPAVLLFGIPDKKDAKARVPAPKTASCSRGAPSGNKYFRPARP